jgi:twitching motility protein PilT
VAAYELLVCTPAIRNLIREKKTYRIDSMIQIGKKFGMTLLDDHLFSLYQEGTVTAEEALYKARKPDELRQKISDFDAQNLSEGTDILTMADDSPQGGARK